MDFLVGEVDEGLRRWCRAFHASTPEHPGGHGAPACEQFTVQAPVFRLQLLDEPPETGRMIHVFSVSQLVYEQITDNLRREEDQRAVQADGPAGRTTSPPGPLTSDRHARHGIIQIVGQLHELWHETFPRRML